ncbi:unnamed protein product [Rotaria magnacalcarata]
MLKTFHAYDQDLSFRWALFGRLNSRYIHLRKLVIALEFSGSGYVWIPYSLIMIGLHHTSINEAMPFILLFIGLMYDIAIIGITKRPDKFSFPSGHTSRAVFLLFYFIETTFFQQISKSVIISWLGSVVASRILLGRHYVSDVLAGVLFGIFECATIVRLSPFVVRFVLSFYDISN